MTTDKADQVERPKTDRLIEILRDNDAAGDILCGHAADEIARLHGVNDRLRAEMERLRAMVFNPVTLTDAEREAVEAILADPDSAWSAYNAATLRGLLERTAGDRPEAIETGESDRPKPIADARLAALQRLAELDEELGVACTPNPHATPGECTVPPEWTSKPYWVDPPSGWRYGFPRLYDPASDGDMTEWLIASGYPERLARQGLACTFTACTEDAEK